MKKMVPLRSVGTLAACILAFLLASCTRDAQSHDRAAGPDMEGLSYTNFDVSPDEKTIVFSGAGDGGLGLYLLDLTTNRVTRLIDTPAYENYPAFSPDGKSVVYQSAKDLSAPRHLFLRSLDGQHVRQLTDTPGTSDNYPCFSPDGKQIVFARSQLFHDGARGENTWSDIDISLIHRDGSALRQLTHFHSEGEVCPKFCPDNRHVLYEHPMVLGTPLTGISGKAPIEKLDTAGHDPVQKVVHFGEDIDVFPYPSPDGQSLVFCRSFGGGGDEYLYRAPLWGDASPSLVSGNPGVCYVHLVISRNGRHIYCKGMYGPILVVMNANGSGLRQIADSSLFSDPMHWKPAPQQ